MDESIARLEALCAARGLEKFSAEEMVALLEDGETAEWIAGQVLPAERQEERRELEALLAEIAVGVAPEPAAAASAQAAEEGGELDLEDLENISLPPGVDLDQVKELLSSPRGALLADFGAFCQERGVDPEMGQEQVSGAMQELHDEWLQTPREALEGKKPAEVLEGGRLFPGKVETYRREQPKVGRNDPCPCGSGKKYKKCCGKAA